MKEKGKVKKKRVGWRNGEENQEGKRKKSGKLSKKEIQIRKEVKIKPYHILG